MSVCLCGRRCRSLFEAGRKRTNYRRITFSGDHYIYDIIEFMGDREPDKKADKVMAEDRGEPIIRMEPLMISESSRFRSELADLALDLTAESTRLRQKPAG